MHKGKRKLGVWQATALVTGNMIGSGIFLLPTSLSPFGGISIIGWIITTIGALSLAFLFAKLSGIIPKAGGPYAYTKVAMGNFSAFIVAWGYWVSIWCGNAAISIALIGYLAVFFPILQENNLLGCLFAIAIVFLFVWVNSRGIRYGGILAVISTFIKIVPIIGIAFFGIFYFDIDNLLPFNATTMHPLNAISMSGSIALWSFLGIESASVAAEEIDNPNKNTGKATIAGTSISALVYIGSTFVIMGMIDPAVLQSSDAPFALAAEKIGGINGKTIVALAAIVSCLGALNGWTIILGQVPMAAARDGLFPKFFAKKNTNEVPVISICMGSAMVVILLLMNYTKSLHKQFEFIILLSAFTCLVPYLFSCISFLKLNLSKRLQFNASKTMVKAVGSVALVFCLWAIYGIGIKIIAYGILLLLVGLPIYYQTKKAR